MEGAPLEVEDLARPSHSPFAGAQAAEIFGRPGHDVGAQLHLDPALGGSADGDVEEDDWVFGGHVVVVG